MWTTATPSILLASILVSASPISPPPGPNNDPQIAERSASVVHFHHNLSPSNATSNVRFVQLERFRIRSKYGKTDSGRTNKAASVASKGRALNETARPFDIKEKRAGLKGTVQLQSESFGRMGTASGPISVGTRPGPQEMSIQFDTGSSDLLLPLSSCERCANPFDPSRSSTFVGSDTPFSIKYEDNTEASGFLATDTVAVAGLTVPQQTFAAIDKATGKFYKGILGLGFHAAASATPFFANLVESGRLESNIFSFYIARQGTEASELCLGGVNSEKYTGAIEYYPIVNRNSDGQPRRWDIQSTGLSYEHQHGTWESEGFAATIDTGTAFIYVSMEIAKKFYDQIPNSHLVRASKRWVEGSYAFPCDSIDSIGKISIGFGGMQYAVDPRDFIAGLERRGSKNCVGAIFGSDDSNEVAILGVAFMKNWYSVFDYANLAVGFAKAA